MYYFLAPIYLIVMLRMREKFWQHEWNDFNQITRACATETDWKRFYTT